MTLAHFTLMTGKYKKKIHYIEEKKTFAFFYRLTGTFEFKSQETRKGKLF
jgi:hypothetical protein